MLFFFFFFNDTATTEIYTLSLHDALPILDGLVQTGRDAILDLSGEIFLVHLSVAKVDLAVASDGDDDSVIRSEEHTSELQSQSNLVCRLLLEKKKRTRGPDSDRRRCTSHT